MFWDVLITCGPLETGAENRQMGVRAPSETPQTGVIRGFENENPTGHPSDTPVTPVRHPYDGKNECLFLKETPQVPAGFWHFFVPFSTTKTVTHLCKMTRICFELFRGIWLHHVVQKLDGNDGSNPINRRKSGKKRGEKRVFLFSLNAQCTSFWTVGNYSTRRMTCSAADWISLLLRIV